MTITALYVCACGYEQPLFHAPLTKRLPSPEHRCPLREREGSASDAREKAI